MSIKAYPLNQKEYSYNAQEVSYYYAGRHSGVFALDTNCQVSIVSNMTIKVAKGKGWLAHGVDYGIVFWMGEDVLLTVPVGDVASPRWDYVCIGWETTEVKENPTIYIKSGSPAVTPAEPTLENSANKIEICLAKIYVPSGTTNLRATGVTLTDTREDKAYCGLVGYDLRTSDLERRFSNLESKTTEIETKSNNINSTLDNLTSKINSIEDGTKEIEKARILYKQRKINDTLFDGSEDIVTNKWGGIIKFIVNNLYGVSVNGASDISLLSMKVDEGTIADNGTLVSVLSGKTGFCSLKLVTLGSKSSFYIQKQSTTDVIIIESSDLSLTWESISRYRIIRGSSGNIAVYTNNLSVSVIKSFIFMEV